MRFYRQHNITECSFDKSKSPETNIPLTLTFHLSATLKTSFKLTQKMCWQVTALGILKQLPTTEGSSHSKLSVIGIYVSA
jgi:hypothetical protein